MAVCSLLCVSLSHAQSNEHPIVGIDTSRYQGRVGYPQVAAQGYSYCFMKATQGASYVDPDYASDVLAARAAGLAVGSYHFFVTGDSAQEQFRNFSRTVTLLPGDLPPVIDVEHMSGAGPELAGELRVLLRLIETHFRVRPIVYSGRAFATDELRTFGDYPLWLAEYDVTAPQLPLGFRDWTFWQHSASGAVAGIEGKVDLDIFHGDRAAFHALRIPASSEPRRAPCREPTCGGHFEPDVEPAPAAPSALPTRAILLSAVGLLCALLALIAWRRRAKPAQRPSLSEAEPAKAQETTPEPDALEAALQTLRQPGPEALESRLDAIHELARLARSTPAQQPKIVSALSAFVRDGSPRTAKTESTHALPADVEMALHRLAELGGLRLPGGDLRGCLLQGARLDGAQLPGANLQGTNLQGATLRNAVLDGANLQGAYLQGAFLEGARLHGAFLEGAFLAGAQLAQAQLVGAFMQRTNLPGSNLRGANLSGTNLPAAHLPGAHLVDSDLRGANLQGANVQGADLSGARMDDCLLLGARLSGARREGANVEAAVREIAARTTHGERPQLGS
jgi:lysozyme